MLSAFAETWEDVIDHFNVLFKLFFVLGAISTNGKVFFHRQPSENMASFRHIANTHLRALMGRNMGDVLSVIEHHTALGLNKSHNGLNQCGFARAVWTNDRNQFAGLNIQAYTVEDFHHSVGHEQIFDLQHDYSSSSPR